MTTIKEYIENIGEELEPVANSKQCFELVAIAYEISNLTDAVYKLIDAINEKKGE